MENTIIFVASDLRSGSTLLDRLISNGREIATAGELANLSNYVNLSKEGPGTTRNWVCRCGQRLKVCPFWSEVAESYEVRTGRSILHARTAIKPLKRSIFLVIREILYFLLYRLNSTIKPTHDIVAANGFNVSRDCYEIFDAISRCTGRRIFVDSSKKAEQLAVLKLGKPKNYHVKVIHIVRDGRAVALSAGRRARESKKKKSFAMAAMNWVIANLMIENVVNSFSHGDYCRIRYEDLCRNTETTMRAVCARLGLGFEPSMCKLIDMENHNIGGTPHAFSSSSEIVADESWKDRITVWQRFQFLLIGGLANRWYGY